MRKPIILMGPMAAGKSTVACLLSSLTGVPNVPMDRVRWYFYFKNGFSQAHDSSLASLSEHVAYWKPFEAKAVIRVVEEFPESIIDFGAGHSTYEDDGLFEAVAAALDPLPNIFLLMPSEDREKSLSICNQRLAANGRLPDPDMIEVNRKFINHMSSYNLAKTIVYTQEKTIGEVAEEIQGLLK